MLAEVYETKRVVDLTMLKYVETYVAHYISVFKTLRKPFFAKYQFSTGFPPFARNYVLIDQNPVQIVEYAAEGAEFL